MMTHPTRPVRRLTLLALLAVIAVPLRAEITSIQGSVEAEVAELRDGSAGDRDRVFEAFPDTATTLPIDAIARLLSGSGEVEGVGISAAQFADPRDLAQPNPEEFAINLALNSVSSSVAYQGRAITREVRAVTFTPAEFPQIPTGERVPVFGQIFLDGALAVFALDAQTDLTGAHATIRVEVLRHGGSLPDETVFRGEIDLRGTTDGQVRVVTSGDIPAARLILTNLSVLNSDFAAFHALIIPRLTMTYPYDAVVGESFTLSANITAEAGNLPGRTGVAVILGTPVDSLADVIRLTRGQQVAAKTITALQNERAHPTGTPVTPDPGLGPLLPACGLVGFEGLLGFVALAGWRIRGSRWRR